MKSIIKMMFAGILIAGISSCDREDPTPVKEDIGGKGGNAVINAIPRHHGNNIDSCTIYIKYNTLDKPNPVFNASQYDDSVKCVKVNNNPTATFTGLKKGKYFLYGVGWDPQGFAVEAGKPVTITAEQTYEVVVPVTEGD